MAKFIQIQVMSGRDVVINTETVVSISTVLSDHTGSITHYYEIRLNNGSKWHTLVPMDKLLTLLNQ